MAFSKVEKWIGIVIFNSIHDQLRTEVALAKGILI